MPKALAPVSDDEKRRRRLTNGQLADEIGGFQRAVDELKAEAIRRGITRAEGLDYRIVLSPPGTQQRTDRAKLLVVLGITEAEFIARFCDPVSVGWRLICSKLRKHPQPKA